MENIVGIFHSSGPAMQAVRDLISRDIPENAIVFVSKEAFQKGENRAVPEKALDEVRTTGPEPTGGGKTMGSVLGAFAGSGGCRDCANRVRTQYNAFSPAGRVFHRRCTHSHCSGYFRTYASIIDVNFCVLA
jgi:hypothetical protein